jgi:adenylate cyclase
LGTDEEGTLATLTAFRSVTDDFIEKHGGRICGTAGDSVLAAFASALEAVLCAIDIQQELAELNKALKDERRMLLRIGINVGDVMVKEGDIFGDGVNIAARLEGLADPGGVCISRGVHDHVMRKLPFDFEDLGEQSVKNIAQPIRAYRLILDGRKLEPAELESSSTRNEAEVPSLQEAVPSAEVDPRTVEPAFWDSVKDTMRASEYEAYLERYPDGAFVALAQARLQAIEGDDATVRTPQDREIELAFWDSVRGSENPDAIAAYLDKYPTGEFSAIAQIRLDELRTPVEAAPSDLQGSLATLGTLADA